MSAIAAAKSAVSPGTFQAPSSEYSASNAIDPLKSRKKVHITIVI
jgi:hypothetical protein